MMYQDYSEILVCPECKKNVREVRFDGRLLGFSCKNCKFIYPIKENIPILLGKKSRNHSLEHDLISHIKKEALHRSIGWLQECVDNTLKVLETSKNMKSWEWEDEEFWSKEYEKETSSEVQKNWNDRIWQRAFLVDRLNNYTKLNGKTILDIGCGEGQNFRLLLFNYCDESTLYIACDISFDGLKLNRSRNMHKNSLYILCSATNLPFREGTIDILCYFGVLHHTEKKAAAIPEDIKLLKSGGYMLLHEGLERAEVSLLSNCLNTKLEKSAHEERIDKEELMSQVFNAKDLEVVAQREMHTVFFTGMMIFFQNIMINSMVFFNFVTYWDILFTKLFGKISAIFKPGEIMLLVRKNA